MARGDITLEELLKLAVESHLAGVNISIPGRVESYDVDSQTADVRPMVRRLVPDPTGEGVIQEDLPVVPKVKVLHPGGADWSLHVPIKEGDSVLLVFSQVDPSEYFRTGQLSNPPDQRLSSLAHAVAIPGLRVDSQAIPGANSSDVRFRHSSGFTVVLKSSGVMEVGGSTDAAAKASEVDDQFNTLKTAISGWVPVPNDGGAALKAALATWYGDPAASASTKLKIGG